MKTLRRTLIAAGVIGVAGVVGGLLRVFRVGEETPTVGGGGWQELQPPDFR